MSDTGCATAAQAWTSTLPIDPDIDCADGDARAHAGATAFQITPIAGAFPDADFDFNCDFIEEPVLPDQGACVLGAGCDETVGWLGAPPACGDSDLFITGCDAGCDPVTTMRVQGCR